MTQSRESGCILMHVWLNTNQSDAAVVLLNSHDPIVGTVDPDPHWSKTALSWLLQVQDSSQDSIASLPGVPLVPARCVPELSWKLKVPVASPPIVVEMAMSEMIPLKV